MIDEKEVLKILKRYEGRMNPTAYFSLEADIVNIEALEQEPNIRNCFGCKYSKDNHNAGTEECHLCMWENQYTPTTKNDLGVDCISRKAVLSTLDNMDSALDEDRTVDSYKELLKECYKVLPSATPQEPKTGEWIEHFDESGKWYECDQCHTDWGGAVNFCPNCGADMRGGRA